MQRNATPVNIVLGKGIFKVDDVAIGLTRDGGNFSVEFENRLIEADGDRGPVKGRILREKAIAKLQLNHLELLTGFEKLHPAIKHEIETNTGTSKSKHRITGTGKIIDTDYHKVEFVGETKDGEVVTIGVEDAINLENIDLALKDKDDIIDKITFTGTYEENQEDDDEKWYIEYLK